MFLELKLRPIELHQELLHNCDTVCLRANKTFMENIDFEQNVLETLRKQY